MTTAACAERAHRVESGRAGELDTDAFVANLVDMIVASLTAPSSILHFTDRSRSRAAHLKRYEVPGFGKGRPADRSGGPSLYDSDG